MSLGIHFCGVETALGPFSNESTFSKLWRRRQRRNVSLVKGLHQPPSTGVNQNCETSVLEGPEFVASWKWKVGQTMLHYSLIEYPLSRRLPKTCFNTSNLERVIVRSCKMLHKKLSFKPNGNTSILTESPFTNVKTAK